LMPRNLFRGSTAALASLTATLVSAAMLTAPPAVAASRDSDSDGMPNRWETAHGLRPHVDDDRVCYLGSVGPERRSELLASAAALLHPIAFAEPFGLAVVEAMAAGTPVVAYARGAMPEVVDEGVTGFLVDDVTAAVAAVGRAVGLDRTRVRRVAEDRFSADRMVSDYLAVYESLLR